jgi:alanine racemase
MLAEWKPFRGGPLGGALMADPPLARASSSGLLVIDLAALRRNYRILKEAVQPAACGAVVKADAYGLGAVPVVKALMAAECGVFFTATLSEAKALRQAAPGLTVYAFNGLLPGSAAEFAQSGVRPVLNSLEEVEEWASYNDRAFKRLPAAIHIDTGMNRLGLPATDAARIARNKALMEQFPTSLVMSHLACGDDPSSPRNGAQAEAFAALAGLFPGAQRSLANSAGVFLGRSYHFDLARPGVALYGGRYSLQGVNPMEPVVRLYGRIAQLRVVEKGETVGYGGAFTARRRMRVATLCAGYADGFSRRFSAEGETEGWALYVGDRRAPVIGRVSMDLVTLDVTDIPETIAMRGALVEIIGEHINVDAMAAALGTIDYEVLTQLGRRYERVYAGL